MTKADALVNSQYGVRAKCICLGLINTPVATFNGNLEPIESMEPILNGLTPMERMGVSSKLVYGAVFLSSRRQASSKGILWSLMGG